MGTETRTPDELRRLADEIETRDCTGVTAAWCPVHGYCSCDGKDEFGLSDPGCLLHAPSSAHAAACSPKEGTQR